MGFEIKNGVLMKYNEESDVIGVIIPDSVTSSSYTERETSTPKTNIAYEDSSGNITVERTSETNAVSPQNRNDDGMVSASPSTETDDTKESSTTNIILIIIGILIAIGLGIIAYMLKKRKDEN